MLRAWHALAGRPAEDDQHARRFDEAIDYLDFRRMPLSVERRGQRCGEEERCRRAESVGNAPEDRNRRLTPVPFDQRQVRRRDLKLPRQLLLREPGRPTQRSDDIS